MRVTKDVVLLFFLIICGSPRGRRLTKTAMVVSMVFVLIIGGPAKALNIVSQTTRKWRKLGSATALFLRIASCDIQSVKGGLSIWRIRVRVIKICVVLLSSSFNDLL